MKFIEKPNLPQGRVRKIIVGKEYCDIIDFAGFGIEAIGIDKSPDLDEPVQSHIDLQVVHLYRNVLYLQPELYCKANTLYNINKNLICKLGESKLQKEYPECAAYNVLILGDKVFCNTKVIEKNLLRELSDKYRIIHVNQGFTRCSVCVVNKNAVITADTGIEKAMRDNGIDVLKINPENIILPGYDYGFIGGASFKLSKDDLAFTGKLDKLPDKKRILDFLHRHGVREVYLTERDIFDIGSAVPIIEE